MLLAVHTFFQLGGDSVQVPGFVLGDPDVYALP